MGDLLGAQLADDQPAGVGGGTDVVEDRHVGRMRLQPVPPLLGQHGGGPIGKSTPAMHQGLVAIVILGSHPGYRADHAGLVLDDPEDKPTVRTPAVAYATGNLPALLDTTTAGILAPLQSGPGGLWQAARDLLTDPVRYRQACRATYCRSRNYRPADIADAFLKAVW
jgi:hypothetical protein